MGGAKHWCFTLFDVDYFLSNWYEHVQYMIWQHEICPETLRMHVQGYICLKKKHELSWVKSYLNRAAHWEGKKGTVAECIIYCSKLESRVPYTCPFEWGERPVEAGTRTDIKGACDMILAGKRKMDIALQYPTVHVKYYRGLNDFRNTVTQLPTERPKVIVLYGDSNTGKSHYGKSLGTWHQVNVDDKVWFDGYEDQEVILWDEFTGQWNINFMKNWLRDRPKLPVKGGFVNCFAKYIVLTSNSNPRCWYKNTSAVHIQALFNRFDEVWCVKSTRVKEHESDEHFIAEKVLDSKIYDDPLFWEFVD